MPDPRTSAENLRAVAIFVRAGANPNFTVAAQTLGLSPSGVSKAIARLEANLGVKLINRTTRSISLTPEGLEYFERCQNILKQLDEADAAITMSQKSPAGRLRIQLPRGIGRKIVLPAIPDLLARHPGLSVDIAFDGRTVDIADEGIDILVRFGPPPDSRLIARKLCRIAYGVFGSPDYLRHAGMPRALDELQQHKCLTYVRPQTGKYREWDLLDGGVHTPLRVHGALSMNDVEALLEAAARGAGLVYLPDFMAADALKAGALQTVLPQHIYEGAPLYLVYPQSRVQPARVKEFTRFLAGLLPAEPPWFRLLEFEKDGQVVS